MLSSGVVVISLRDCGRPQIQTNSLPLINRFGMNDAVAEGISLIEGGLIAGQNCGQLIQIPESSNTSLDRILSAEVFRNKTFHGAVKDVDIYFDAEGHRVTDVTMSFFESESNTFEVTTFLCGLHFMW